MTVATDLINKSFGDYQAMSTLFFDDFMGTQLKNLTHVRGPYPSFYELFPELSDTTRINVLEAFVLRTLTLSSQGVDCAPGKAFAQRMDYIATNLGFENAFVVLLHCYHLASFKGYANNAQYIKEKMQNLYEENPDKALSIGSAPIAFNRFLVLPSCFEQLEKNSSNKMQQNSTKWVKIILGISAIAAAIAGGAYYLHTNKQALLNQLQESQKEKLNLEQQIQELQGEKDSCLQSKSGSESNKENLEKQIIKLNDENGSCLQSKSGLESNKENLEKQIQELQGEKDSCLQSKSGSESSKENLEKQIKQLQSEKGVCTQSESTLKPENANWEDQIKQLQGEQDDCLQSKSELESKKTDLEQRIRYLEAEKLKEKTERIIRITQGEKDCLRYHSGYSVLQTPLCQTYWIEKSFDYELQLDECAKTLSTINADPFYLQCRTQKIIESIESSRQT